MEDFIIQKNRIKPEAIDYKLFRQKGIDYIVKLGNKLWSDHNIHDPGITVLELLCYALTDLGYRTSFNIKDILTPPGKKGPDIHDTFFPAHEILSCHPLTNKDYCKWILEHIPCIRNVWVNTCDDKSILIPKNCFRNGMLLTQDIQINEEVKLKGFYHITVDLEDFDKLSKYRTTFGRTMNGRFVSKEEYLNDIKGDNKYCRSYIRNMFLKIRNLCEDIEDVTIMNHVNVGICAVIEIKPDMKYEPVIEEINKRMNNYINPAIQFYTLSQMLEKDIPVEKIYQGYIPKLGFINYNEIDRLENIKQLNVSDAINLIMGIEGVLNVSHFHFMVEDEAIKNKILLVTNAESVILINKDYSFRFYNLDKPNSDSLNELVITRGLLTFKPDINNLKFAEEPETRDSTGSLEFALPLQSGNNRELDQYISIQDEFPKTYKIGREGIANSETDQRKAQRLQFKAYLLFFDQLLADYLAQLNSVKDIFSWKEPLKKENDNTYFFKNLSEEEITGFSKIFSGYEKYKAIVEPETVRLDRKNRFLNHLIARFNEEFVDYSILEFLHKEENARKDFDEQELIVDKKTFLRNYVNISCDRSHAFDYTEPYNGGTDFFIRGRNVCGLETVLYSKLGLDPGFINRKLAVKIGNKDKKTIFSDNRNGNYNDNFGLHVYEHLLLRPLCSLNGNIKEGTFLKLTTDVNQTQIIKDPYSMQITIVVPGWLRISSNLDFRKFIERMIRMEVPAHIAAKVCWLNPYQMHLVETRYEKFLSILAKQPYPVILTKVEDRDEWEKWQKQHTNALNDLIGIFSVLQSIYPPTQLYSDVYSMGDYSAILDYSMLGGDDNTSLWAFESTEEIK